MRAIRRTVAGVGFVAAALMAPTVAPPASADEDHVIATYHGEPIDLAEDWGSARACHAAEDGTTTCYASEGQMDAALDRAAASIARNQEAVVAFASCSSYLRLYSATLYGGSVLSLSLRGTVINLGGYGFDNITSSYKVGACSSTFYDGANGGAPIYPGYTGAFAQASSMLAGWDNRVSSVYIS
jgi:hypothetical protein